MNPLDRLLAEASAAMRHRTSLRRKAGKNGGARPTERSAADLCASLASTRMDQRDAFRTGLTDRQRVVLGQYGHQSAAVALRERWPERLRIGLIAIALEDTNVDARDLMIGVALHYHVAQQLGLTPTEVFDEAASYAAADTADVLRTFGRRTDVTLKVFGWHQIDTPDGPAFTFRY